MTHMSKIANRNSLLAQIHIAKKDLKLDDGEYRDLMATVCGKHSAADLDVTGLRRFLDHLSKCRSAMKGGATKARRKLLPRAGKIFSLWQQLADAKLVEQRAFPALEAWVKAQTGVDKLEWLNEHQASQCIEQLKLWLTRKPLPHVKKEA